MKREWKRSGWRVEFDSSEVCPTDPGNGTPVMVYGPKNISGTYECAIGTGECDGEEIPSHIYSWLESLENEIEDSFNVIT